MVIDGFLSLWIPLNLAEPAYLEHVFSVFIFSLRLCEKNWPLFIGPLQFLNYSSYWSSGTIQSLFTLYQVKQFILASGSVPDHGTKEPSSSWYNPTHRGESILSPDPSTFSDHLTITIVDVGGSSSTSVYISLGICQKPCTEFSDRLWGGLVCCSEFDVVRSVPEEYFIKYSSSEGTDIGAADSNGTWGLCRHHDYIYLWFLWWFVGDSKLYEES